MASSNPSSVVAPPVSKFEFQADDGAWYNVLLELNDDALTVNYCLLSSDDHEVFKPTHFTTLDDLESFARRFRPSSLQLQDDECQKVVPCMRVLAACRSGCDDVRFYEAIIEEVERQDHTFENGIEVCCCNFLLHWLHGPSAGNLTCCRAADICLLQFTADTDPKVDSFLERSMEIIGKTSFCPASTSRHDAAAGAGDTGQSRIHFLNPGVSPLCEQRLKETRYLQQCENKGGSFEGRISNLHKVIDDKYLVGSSFMRNIEEIGNLGNALNSMEELFGQYVIVIENLEEELSSANIAGFIREKIHISPEVYIYQSLLLQSYTWAVVMGNDKEELKKLRDFLCDPNQIIISSRGRPWVITDKVPRLGTLTRLLLPRSGNRNIRRGIGLKIVHSSSDEYQRAKQLRDSFMEFKNSQEKLKNHLALEEENSELFGSAASCK
ncbi:hypothetical protein AAG906_039938 [Vitis piasezkii]